jgi:UDP-N-acetyl-D-galactosamine dehydrogenase
MERSDVRIGIIGLGYVGLPLAVQFAKQYNVLGFDINFERIHELRKGVDHTLEIDEENLNKVLKNNLIQGVGLFCTHQLDHLKQCNIYIITVPTPVDKNKRPDLTPLYRASEAVGSLLKIDDIVIYESTVYPGATEEECVPVLEKFSRLKYNSDFFCGYSPERINPGDKNHTLTFIRKITSGSNPDTTEKVDELYKSIITAGTHKVSSIKVAEAAKVIENAQRDINIAFVNELAKIFNLLNIDTNEVLAASATKWNFLPFKPGLVGGHCIGVDPYYLAQKAQEMGYHPEIILAGRRLNDSMGPYIAHEIVRLMILNEMTIKNSHLLLLGITFKENCPDVRNTKVVDIVYVLQSYGIKVIIFDPWAHQTEVSKEYGLETIGKLPLENKYDCVILSVAHDIFLNTDWTSYLNPKGFIFDVKGCLPKAKLHYRL